MQTQVDVKAVSVLYHGRKSLTHRFPRGVSKGCTLANRTNAWCSWATRIPKWNFCPLQQTQYIICSVPMPFAFYLWCGTLAGILKATNTRASFTPASPASLRCGARKGSSGQWAALPHRPGLPGSCPKTRQEARAATGTAWAHRGKMSLQPQICFFGGKEK